MAMQTTSMERALGAIGTTFRMTRLYPPIHPALVEAVRQVTETLPALDALGPVEWKVGATGIHWQGQHLLPKNTQVSELAGLLFARPVELLVARAVAGTSRPPSGQEAARLQGLLANYCTRPLETIGGVVFRELRRCEAGAPAQ